MSWGKRLKEVLVEGILWGLYYWLLFAVIVPLLIDRFLGGVASEVILPKMEELIGFILLFLALSIAAKGLRGTLYSPLIRALESFLGFAVASYFLNGGLVSANLPESGIAVTLDLSPILVGVFLFFTLPGVVMPFIDYFLEYRD